jgi:hypothetical protein
MTYSAAHLVNGLENNGKSYSIPIDMTCRIVRRKAAIHGTILILDYIVGKKPLDITQQLGLIIFIS